MPWMKPVIHSVTLAKRRVAILVEVAGVDPHDVGLGPVLCAGGAVEVELLLEHLVREERDGDAPAPLRRERVRAIRGTAGR